MPQSTSALGVASDLVTSIPTENPHITTHSNIETSAAVSNTLTTTLTRLSTNLTKLGNDLAHFSSRLLPIPTYQLEAIPWRKQREILFGRKEARARTVREGEAPTTQASSRTVSEAHVPEPVPKKRKKRLTPLQVRLQEVMGDKLYQQMRKNQGIPPAGKRASRWYAAPSKQRGKQRKSATKKKRGSDEGSSLSSPFGVDEQEESEEEAGFTRDSGGQDLLSQWFTKQKSKSVTKPFYCWMNFYWV